MTTRRRRCPARGTLLLAAVTVLALVGGVFGWTLFAHLDSAVIARGVVIADSQRKTVQHLEGGILRQLLVHEGQLVRAGEPVALLDTTHAEVQYAQLADQLFTVRARLARLDAEQRGGRELAFPEVLRVERTGHEGVLEGQRQLFEARWRAHDGTVAVLKKRIAQLESGIKADQAQQATGARQLELVREEFESADYLLQKGMERRSRWLELQRDIAALEGQQRELVHTVGRAEEAIAEARLEIENTRHRRLAEIAQEFEEARALEGELANQLRAARDILDRREIRAPQDGIVVELRIVTPGGVIGSGQPLMDIVPADDELIVETRVQPVDIETVEVGLPARVRLSAYQRSTAPLLDGEVSYISADLLEDQRTGDAYFVARVRLAAADLAALDGVRLLPGMPVEVMIVTGERRAIDYLLEPVLRHLRRAFRED